MQRRTDLEYHNSPTNPPPEKKSNSRVHAAELRAAAEKARLGLSLKLGRPKRHQNYQISTASDRLVVALSGEWCDCKTRMKMPIMRFLRNAK